MSDNSNPAPDRKAARRKLQARLKAAAWSALVDIDEPPRKPVSVRATLGQVRVDVIAAAEGATLDEMPLLGPLPEERRVWEVVLAEKRRDPVRPVKTITICRLAGLPNSTATKTLLRLMVRRGWLVARHKQGYDLNVAPPPTA